MKRIRKTQPDKEEKALISSFENNEWKSVKNLKKEKSLARQAAAKTLKKLI